MQADVRETIAQVRDLAHGIYPPLLRQAGLPEALRAAATRSPNAVTVELAGVDGRQEPDVEAALYFCASRRCRTSPSTHPTRPPPCGSATATTALLVLEVDGRRPRLRRRRAASGGPGPAEHDRPGRRGRRRGARRRPTPARGHRVRAEVPVPVRAG